MRLYWGAIPEMTDFNPEEEGWQKIREPGPIMLQLIALPVGLAVFLITATIFWFALPVGNRYLEVTLPTAIALLAIIPAHEILHALVNPAWGLTADTVIGVWPSKGLFYSCYLGEISRNRSLLSCLLPLLVLTVAPICLVVFGLAYVLPDRCMSFLVLVSMINAAASSGDIICMTLLYFQAPRGAWVRSQGWCTYWKCNHIRS